MFHWGSQHVVGVLDVNSRQTKHSECMDPRIYEDRTERIPKNIHLSICLHHIMCAHFNVGHIWSNTQSTTTTWLISLAALNHTCTDVHFATAEVPSVSFGPRTHLLNETERTAETWEKPLNRSLQSSTRHPPSFAYPLECKDGR